MRRKLHCVWCSVADADDVSGVNRKEPRGEISGGVWMPRREIKRDM